MAEATFPPPTKVPYSIRVQEIEATRFLGIRKVASEGPYKNEDGSFLMSYGDTLRDREAVKKAVIDYEIAHGYVIDDRGMPGATPIINMPAPVPQEPVVGFQNTTPIPSVPQAVQMPMQMPSQPPQPPPQAAPQQSFPQMQPPPEGGGMELPTGKARRARPGALPSSVAPPPPPPDAIVIPTLQNPNPQFVTGLSLAPPQGVTSQVAPPPPPPLPVAPTQFFQSPVQGPDLTGPLNEIKGILSKLAEKGTDADFKQVVSNLSAQINETNKQLAENNGRLFEMGEYMKAMKKRQDASLVALSHIYRLSKIAPPEVTDTFEAFLKYLEPWVPK